MMFANLQYNETLATLEFTNVLYRELQALLVHLMSTQPYTESTRIFGNNIACGRESMTDENIVTTTYRFPDDLHISVGMSKRGLFISASRWEFGYAPIVARASIHLES